MRTKSFPQFRNPASRQSRKIVNNGFHTKHIVERLLRVSRRWLTSRIHPSQISVSWASCGVSVLNTRLATLRRTFKHTNHVLWIYISQVTTLVHAEYWVLMKPLLPFWPHASTALTGWLTCRWSSAMPVMHMVMHSIPPTWMSYVSKQIRDAIRGVASIHWYACIMIIILSEWVVCATQSLPCLLVTRWREKARVLPGLILPSPEYTSVTIGKVNYLTFFNADV